jgi:hypothetical protein
MSDKAVLIVLVYMTVALGIGILIGKRLKQVSPLCRHEWEDKGYGGAGWTLKVCKNCGEREIDS